MTYLELQSALKTFRNDGISVNVPLNSKLEVLQAEYDRINKIPVTPGEGIFSETVTDTLQLFAKSLVGNWVKFNCFMWDRYDDLDANNLAILYTTNRDADLVTESNHHHLVKVLQTAIDNGTVSLESHSHWACGYVEGLVFPVYKEDGSIYEHVELLYKQALRLAQYPLLNEDDYSDREFEANQESLEQLVKDSFNSSEFDFDDSLVDVVVEYINNNSNYIDCDQLGNVINIDPDDYIFPAIEASIDLQHLTNSLYKLSHSTYICWDEWKDDNEDGSDPCLDIRLNFTDSWKLLWGLSDFDQSHRGLWASGSLTQDMTQEECQVIAQELIKELQ